MMRSKHFGKIILLGFLGFFILLHSHIIYLNPQKSLVLWDSDSYMRLAKVLDVYSNSFSWSQNLIERSNAPWGDKLHWTKPLDLIYLSLAYIIKSITKLSFKDSLTWGACSSNILFHLISCFVIGSKLEKPQKYASWFIMSSGTILLQYSGFLRPDHHSLLVLVLSLVIVNFSEMLKSSWNNHNGKKVGFYLALGSWISFEFLGVWIAVFLPLWLKDFFKNKIHHLTFMQRPESIVETTEESQAKKILKYLFRFLLIFLIIERFDEEMFSWELDRLSMYHLILALYGFVCFKFSSRLVVLATIPLVAYSFYQKMIAVIPEAVRPIWHDYISEIQPIITMKGVDWSDCLLYLFPSILAIFYVLGKVISQLRSGNPSIKSNLLYPFYLFSLLFYLIMAIYQKRHGLFLQTFAAIPLSRVLVIAFDFIKSLKIRDATRGILKGLAFSIMIFGGLFGSKLLEKPTKVERSLVSFHEIIDYLKSIEGSKTILSGIDVEGPMILYETHHKVIATPYHRHIDAVKSTYEILSTSDEQLAKKLIQERKIDLIVLEKYSINNWLKQVGVDINNSFYGKALGGEIKWLKSLALPGNLEKDFIVLEACFMVQ